MLRFLNVNFATRKSHLQQKKQHRRVLFSNLFSADEIVYANVERIGEFP